MERKARRRTSWSHRIASLFLLFVAASCALLGESVEPKDVRLVFDGLGSLDREVAVERIAYLFEDFARVPVPESVLDDASFELELLLRDQGYRSARVVGRLDRPQNERPIARFQVEPGTRTAVEKISLEGVSNKDREIATAILRSAFVGDWFSQRGLGSGTRGVLEWYRERGYVDATATEPTVEFSEDGGLASVMVAFTPGSAYVLQEIRVDVVQGTWPVEVPRTAIDEALKDLVHAPYSDRSRRLARGRIASVFGEHAHPDADVSVVDEPLDPAGVVLRFHVEPGPRVRVGAVKFVGQDSTNEEFLEDRVDLESGAWYERSRLRSSLANLSRAGIFDRVAIDLEKSPDGPDADGVETRDVRVEVEEAASREYHIEPGYGSYERLRIGVGARQKNLFGTGRILDFSVTAAQLAQRADLSLIDPWILGSDATAIATLFWNRREEPSFDRLETGLELGAAWRLSTAWSVRTSWEFRRSSTSNVEVDAPEIVEDLDVSEVSIEPGWDTRDAFDDPHQGQLSRGAVDLSLDAFGSQVEYVRLKLEHAHFLPLGSRTTLALSVRAGWIAPLGSTDEIPIQERFFNGGENSVRSFNESQLGPEDDNGKPVGGEASTTATIELRQGLAKRFQLAAFVDAGTVELRNEDIFRFHDPGFGVGLGLRYLLPIGPIRLDGAVNPSPDVGEADYAIHLSVGFSF